MQPHRISRFLLDGVASASDYYTANFTSENVDADSVVEAFFTYCAAAGPLNCSMYAGNSSTDTRNLLWSIVNDITTEGPISVPSIDNTTGPQVITLSDIKYQLWRTVYSPLDTFPVFADIVAPLADRNGSAFAAFKASQTIIPPLSPGSDADIIDPYNPYTGPQYFNPFADFITMAISSGDTTTRLNKTTFQSQVWYPLKNELYWAGDAFATIYLPIYSWPSTARWRFEDTHVIGISNASLTPHPILFASNLVDPATSLTAAKEMHAAFAGSGLLLNDGEGHITSSAPSLCVVKKFREYFQTGQLPSGLDQTCLPYERPFLGVDGPRTAPFDPNAPWASMEDIVLFNASIAYGG